MLEKKIKIIITGGHITPALATIKELQKQNVDILFVGRSYTDENKSPSLEKKLVEELGVKFQYFESVKLNRNHLFGNITEIFKFLGSLYRAALIVRDYNPDVILTFGGYLALPVTFAGFFQDVPIITHEQTSVIGLTNKLIEPVAKKLAVSWPTTKLSRKRILIGNPIRSEFSKNTKTPTWYNNPKKLPLIYITGGNQGSKAINTHISKIIDSLSEFYFLVLQTGSTRNKQDFNLLTKTITKLSSKNQKNIYISTWFNASEVAWLMKNSDLIIGRSGANTATEILVSRANSILIPLPTSAGGEQYQNAKFLEKLGLSYVLNQTELNNLEEVIYSRLGKKNQSHFPDLESFVTLHQNAAAKLADLTLKCVEK